MGHIAHPRKQFQSIKTHYLHFVSVWNLWSPQHLNISVALMVSMMVSGLFSKSYRSWFLCNSRPSRLAVSIPTTVQMGTRVGIIWQNYNTLGENEGHMNGDVIVLCWNDVWTAGIYIKTIGHFTDFALKKFYTSQIILGVYISIERKCLLVYHGCC